ncbi:4Fe-4S binding protein [Clostridium lundense]|uniref:4Fe-4S binding protein n=1 Tax=Clostridium lundense TaxID=319475 RepID=UPI0009FFBEC6|nr:4Fe-4S binding protein [Clostridium lundense]
MMKLNNKWKWIISIFFLGFSIFAGKMHQIKGGGPAGSPSTDALCPFGGLETLYSLLTKNTYIEKITPSSLILLLATILLTLVLGRAFCGYICPLGTIQSLLNKLAKKLHIKQIKLNSKLDQALRYAKYVVLFAILFTTYKAGSLILRAYDPWAAFMHLGSGSEIFEEFLIGIIVLILILVSSMFIERAFCRYFCPLGATLAIFTPFSVFKVKRKSSSCVSCKSCSKNCPMGLDVHSKTTPSKTECISCGECISSCHIENTLELNGKNLTLSLAKTAGVIILIAALVIGSSAITGNFKTSLTNSEVLKENNSLNANNIKGYMTIDDICKEFNVDKTTVLQKVKLPLDTPTNIPAKDLKTILADKGIDFDVDSIRTAVKELTQ